MTLFDQTWGTLLNVATVLIGSLVGLGLRGRLPPRITNVVMQAIGLVTIYIGLTNSFDLGKIASPP